MNLAADRFVMADSLSLVIRFERHRTTSKGPRSRFYAMRIERETQLTLDRRALGFLLVVTRGSMSDKGLDARVVVREQRFATIERAIERWGYLCARRRSHGYEEQEQHA